MASSLIAPGGMFILLMAAVHMAALAPACEGRPTSRAGSQLPWAGSSMRPPSSCAWHRPPLDGKGREFEVGITHLCSCASFPRPEGTAQG